MAEFGPVVLPQDHAGQNIDLVRYGDHREIVLNEFGQIPAELAYTGHFGEGNINLGAIDPQTITMC